MGKGGALVLLHAGTEKVKKLLKLCRLQECNHDTRCGFLVRGRMRKLN